MGDIKQGSHTSISYSIHYPKCYDKHIQALVLLLFYINKTFFLKEVKRTFTGMHDIKIHLNSTTNSLPTIYKPGVSNHRNRCIFCLLYLPAIYYACQVPGV